MPHCDCNKFIEKFRQFRHKLYTIIPNRRDTVMDLLDALSSNQTARSPVELSLNPLFRRDYSALYKAIEQFNFNPDCTSDTGEGSRPTEETEQIKKQQALLSLITEVIPAPVQRDFYLFGVDVTPVPRPYARTLQGRTFVYQPNAIKGNKLAQHLPRPWERYLEQNLNTNISPSGVQRDFTRIITLIGTPAKVPKTRGYSSGRPKGTSLKPRTRHQVIKKDKKREQNSLGAA